MRIFVVASYFFATTLLLVLVDIKHLMVGVAVSTTMVKATTLSQLCCGLTLVLYTPHKNGKIFACAHSPEHSLSINITNSQSRWFSLTRNIWAKFPVNPSRVNFWRGGRLVSRCVYLFASRNVQFSSVVEEYKHPVVWDKTTHSTIIVHQPTF